MTRDVISVSFIIFVLLSPLVLCGTISRDKNADLNVVDEDTEAKRLAQLMDENKEESQPNDNNDGRVPEDQRERRIPSAKDLFENYAVKRKELMKQFKRYYDHCYGGRCRPNNWHDCYGERCDWSGWNNWGGNGGTRTSPSPSKIS